MSELQLSYPATSAYCSATYPWYAVRTKVNYERVVSALMTCKGYRPYVPSYKVRSRWSDRIVESERPIFPGYLFCRFDALTERNPILMTPGVITILSFSGEPAQIPDDQIEAVQVVLRSGLVSEQSCSLQAGQKVRVNRGPLEGVTGTLIRRKAEWTLLISIELLNRSLAVEIDVSSVTVL